MTYIINKGPKESQTGIGPVAGHEDDEYETWNYRSAFTLRAGSLSRYFTASKWAIRHETIAFHDPARDNRLVAVDIAVRRDKEMQANAGLIKLPVAVLNHGNTVKHTEYSFLVQRLRLARLPRDQPAA